MEENKDILTEETEEKKPVKDNVIMFGESLQQEGSDPEPQPDPEPQTETETVVDKAISELTELTSSQDDDLFILSQNNNSTYYSYKQKRSDIFNAMFQIANPVLKPIYMDHDPNVEYNGKLYWIKSGTRIKLDYENQSENMYYDKLARLKKFLSDEFMSQTTGTRNIGGVTAQYVKTKSGLYFTNDEGTWNSVFQKNDSVWMYLVDKYTNPTWIQTPKTKLCFTGNGSIGEVGVTTESVIPKYVASCTSAKFSNNAYAGARNLIEVAWLEKHVTGYAVTSVKIKSSETKISPPSVAMGLWFAV